MLSDSNLVLLLAGFCIASYGLWLNAHALPRFLTAKRNLRKALFAASVIAFVLAAEYAVVVQLRSSKSAPDPATNQFVQYAQAYSQIEHESKTKRLGWEYGCRGTDVGLGAGKRLSWEEEVARDEDIAHKTLGTIFDHDRRWAGVHMDRCEMLRFMENVCPVPLNRISPSPPHNSDVLFQPLSRCWRRSSRSGRSFSGAGAQTCSESRTRWSCTP